MNEIPLIIMLEIVLILIHPRIDILIIHYEIPDVIGEHYYY